MSPRKIDAFIQIGLMLGLWVGTVARFYRLEAQSLWSDEGNSIALSQAGFAEIAQRTAFDIHPPLYYWLLKIWLALFGQTEFAIRALSAFLGILLLAVIYRLGQRLFNRQVGLAALLVAAFSPFQIYYAQEARMYMLLTLLGALTVWFAFEAWHAEGAAIRIYLPGYVCCATLGLYTQYAYPLVLGAANLTALWLLWGHKRKLLLWLGAQLIPLLLFLPWLPIAFRQITTWPSLVEQASASQITLALTQHLAVGLSARVVPSGWLIVFGLLALAGIYAGRHLPPKWDSGQGALLVTILWLLLPALAAALFFRPAYLKIFLIASPAFCLLLGLSIAAMPVKAGRVKATLGASLLVLSLLWPSSLALKAYYHDPAFQRDNYRGIARFIQAIGTAGDAVIIHAPGQQDVFGYYFQPGDGRPTVYPLPAQRPLDEQQTITSLSQISKQANRIYGVYWATAEADPAGLIESWLNQHTFKASDTWFGNVRLVSYATPTEGIELVDTDLQFGESIRLKQVGLSHSELRPGEILQLQLIWETSRPLEQNYTVFVQLLDAANYIIGQRDAQPLVPTTSWSVNQPEIDQHGLYIEPGTPPGLKRLIVGLYNAATGERLAVNQGADFTELGHIEVKQHTKSLPLEAYRMQAYVNKPPLVGYDLYKRGFAATPETPLQPGDPLHLNLYWQAAGMRNEPLWLTLIDRAGNRVLGLQAEPASNHYPVSAWLPDEIVRGQFDLFLNEVPPGDYRVEIQLGEQVICQTKTFAVVGVE